MLDYRRFPYVGDILAPTLGGIRASRSVGAMSQEVTMFDVVTKKDMDELR